MADTTRRHEVAEAMIRYRAVGGADGWSIVNMENGRVVDTADDEPMARAAARLRAADDICRLFEDDHGGR